MTNLTITNEDCIDLMRRTPDGYYDLAVVDPEYGNGTGAHNGTGKYSKAVVPKGKTWDDKRADAAYLAELQRVSKVQIVWGGQFFASMLPVSRGWVCWYKTDEMKGRNFSEFELAYTSLDCPARHVSIKPFIRNGGRIHPTQKPVALYRWLLTNYAKPGQRILDTHMGSGSIAIAAYDLGYDLTACELDPDYYAAAMKRIQTHIQTHPFGEDLQPKQANLNGMETLTLFA